MQNMISWFCRIMALNCKGIALDTLIGANLIIKEWQSASLKKLSHSFFNEDMLTYEDVVKVDKYKDFSYVPLEIATLYAAQIHIKHFV